MADTVNHPKHYNTHPSKIECIDVVEHMTFLEGNVIKYVWRAPYKGTELEDLLKAKFYLNKLIKKRKREINGKAK